MTTLTFEVENPIIYFKGFFEFEFAEKIPEHAYDKRYLQADTFSKIVLPSNYFKNIFMEAGWIKTGFPIPIEHEWGVDNKIKFEAFLREPHYAYFLFNFRENLYVDTNGKALTIQDHFLLVAHFAKGYLKGYHELGKILNDRNVQTNLQLAHEILDMKCMALEINKDIFNFDFMIDNDSFYMKGRALGLNYRMNKELTKIPFSDLPKIIDEIELKMKRKFYLDSNFVHKSVSLTFQFNTNVAIKSQQNIVNKMPLNEVYNFFSKNISDTVLSKDNLRMFFLKAFVGYLYPKTFFNIKSERDGTKKEIYKIFYSFYQTCIYDQKFEKEVSCKEKYVRLLCDNFEGFEFYTVKNNFRS